MHEQAFETPPRDIPDNSSQVPTFGTHRETPSTTREEGPNVTPRRSNPKKVLQHNVPYRVQPKLLWLGASQITFSRDCSEAFISRGRDGIADHLCSSGS